MDQSTEVDDLIHQHRQTLPYFRFHILYNTSLKRVYNINKPSRIPRRKFYFLFIFIIIIIFIFIYHLDLITVRRS